MMNLFEYLNGLLFGPTLLFEASSKYSLDDAVNRLRAAVIPRFSLTSVFREGLKGTVASDRVRLRWKCAWRENGFGPMFRGRFVSGAGGLRLVGEIGVPSMQRVLMTLISFLPPILLWPFSDAGALPARLWPITLVPLVGIVVALFASRMFRQRDYQRIADALDNALS